MAASGNEASWLLSLGGDAQKNSGSLPSAGRAGRGKRVKKTARIPRPATTSSQPAPNDMSLAILDESGCKSPKPPLSTWQRTRHSIRSASPICENNTLWHLPDAETLCRRRHDPRKQDEKRVHPVSGRCGWCFVLSRFLDDNKNLVDKDSSTSSSCV